MSKWDQLLVEIMLNIIQFATKANEFVWSSEICEFKIQCLFVSKQWYKISRQVVYKSVVLDTHDDVEKYIAFMLDSSNGSFVRNLFYCNMILNMESNLGPLFKACPNLKVLDCDDVYESFFQKLLPEIDAEENRVKLQQLPFYCHISHRTVLAHGLAAYALRKTLVSLLLCDYRQPPNTFKQNKVLTNLNEFTKLKEISFWLNYQDNLFEVFTNIKKCLTLTDLGVCYADKPLMYLEPCVKWRDLVPLPNITKFDEGGPVILSMTYLQCIMRLLPSLRELNLSLAPASTQAEIMTQTHQIPNEFWIEFIKYTLPIKEGRVFNMYVRDYATVFAKFPSLAEHLQIQHKEKIQVSPHFTIMWNNYRHRDMSVCKVNLEWWGSSTLMAKSMSPGSGEYLPHESLITIYGPKIKTLRLEMVSAESCGVTECGAFKMMNGNLLNPIFEHCLVLREFCVINGNFNYLCPSSFMATKTLERMVFTRCTFRNDFLCELSTLLPDRMEFLDFKSCTIGEERNTVIDMPYTSFGCLTWSTLEPKNYFKVTKRAQSFYFYKIDGENKMALSSPSEFDTFKDRYGEQSIHIRCFDIEKMEMELNNKIYLTVCFHDKGAPSFYLDGKLLDIAIIAVN
ncbi:hypothetical protein INT47_002486 [Mucor saturninus]|uniref:Uncharacterized protein n=1 Tax=Mucor saturninus TaxID=64648 RepID=A0A8H7RGG2_9FUNG|nr:hypothetical protein INT47_002486 [Mucor saturninus]